jgi:type II secretory pathway pseudopilin PulG
MDPFTIGLLGTSLISGGLGFLGSQNQAKATQEASKQQQMMQMLALQQQQQQYQQNRTDLAPYRGFGETAGNQLINRLPELTQGFDPSQANLEQTPGYQFNLSQGPKSGTELSGGKRARHLGRGTKGCRQLCYGVSRQYSEHAGQHVLE